MQTIQSKIFIAFSIVIMSAIVIVTIAAYYNSSITLEKNAITYISDSIRHADDNLQIMLEDIDKINTVVAVNKDRVSSKLISPYEEPTYQWFQEKKSVEDFLTSLIAYKSYISRISIIGINGKIYQSGEPMVRISVMQEPWVAKVLSENKRHFLFNASSNGSVMLARPLYMDGMSVGFVFIDFNPDIIRKLYDIQPLSDSFIALMDPGGKVIYHSEETAVTNNLLTEAYLTDMLESFKQNENKNTRIKQINGETYLAVDFTSAYTGWTTIGMIPQKTLLHDAYLFRQQLAVIAIGVLLAVLVASIFVSNRITKNLTNLRNTMKLVSVGKLTAKPDIKSTDEVGQLSEMFTSMMFNLQELMEETRMSERKKREAEYKALQSQINPHFIYNTLNTIKYLAHLQHVPNIEEISGSLVELLRSLADYSKEMITIKEELDYVKQYINIQKYRVLEPFTVNYDVDEEIMDCMLPKLLLQPLIENSFIHGLALLDKPGVISVKIYSDSEGIKLEVTDNGPGVSSTDTINSIIQDNHSDKISMGIGLSNVNDRIKMAFGDKYGITVFSQPGFMTTVGILIPAAKEDSHAVEGFTG
jgi:two-component system sensor histidine kinase YesM